MDEDFKQNRATKRFSKGDRDWFVSNLFVTCQCCSPEHTLQFIYDHEVMKDGEVDSCLYLYTQLSTGGFFSRVKTAFGYIFGRKTDCHFAETILTKEKCKDIVGLLNQYVEDDGNDYC